MNILRKTVGFLAAVAIAASAIAPVGVTADNAAAEEKTTEDAVVSAEVYQEPAAEETEDEAEQDEDIVPGEDVTIAAGETDDEFAEEFAQMYEDPQYGKYLEAKKLAEETGGDEPSLAYEGMGGMGAYGTTIGDKYYNNDLVHNSRFDGLDRIFGIDVSYFQYDIDWSKVANDVDFAIIRVGYRGYGDSGDLVLDYKFKENIAEAKEAGLEVGVYFYTQAITSVEAREEADFVYKYIKNYELELPVFFDIESVDFASGRLDNAGLTVAQKTQLCKAFCNRIKSYGYDAGVYANMNWLYNKIDGEALGAKYPIWLANYTNETSYTGVYQTWQFSSTGKISGISTNVDMNVDYREPVNKVELDKPSNFKYTVTGDVAIFTADVVEGANKYQLFSYDENTKTYTKVAVADEPMFTIPLSDSYLGYVIRAVNTTGEVNYFSAYSNMLFAQKGMPANFRLEESYGALKVTWDLLDGAEGYVVYRTKGLDGTFTKYRTLSSTSNSIREANLSYNSVYGYKVVPLSGGKEGVSTRAQWYLSPVSKAYTPTVTGCTNDSVTLKWTATEGAAGYEIAVYDKSTGKYTTKATVKGTNTGTVKSLSASTIYNFAIRAYTEAAGSKRFGDYSNTVQGATTLAAPTGIYATATSSGITIKWNKMSGAKYYRVYKRNSDGKFKRIATDIKGKSYKINRAPTSKEVYTVKAVYNVNGKDKISNDGKNVAVNAIPYSTSAFGVVARKSKIRIGWYAVSNCTGYRVYMYNSAAGKYVEVKTITGKKKTNYVASGLSSGTRYKFKVRPYKKGVNGITWGKCSKAIGIYTK